ncbi:hypothetical protein [Streptomyces sp. NPDC048516]|uniref:hypothetical protein n=1 Tax=Streptomyces sp. NPDC048516 TaxID=3365565 RepID=UPI003718D6C8
MSEYASQEAAAALDRAQKLSSKVRKGTRWYVWYYLIFGCATAIQVLFTGLLARPHGVAIGGGLWCATIVGLSLYVARQRVARRGFGWRLGVVIASWGLLYSAVLVPGLTWFQGDPAWWGPGALVVALPGLMSAYLEARR